MIAGILSHHFGRQGRKKIKILAQPLGTLVSLAEAILNWPKTQSTLKHAIKIQPHLPVGWVTAEICLPSRKICPPQTIRQDFCRALGGPRSKNCYPILWLNLPHRTFVWHSQFVLFSSSSLTVHIIFVSRSDLRACPLPFLGVSCSALLVYCCAGFRAMQICKVHLLYINKIKTNAE